MPNIDEYIAGFPEDTQKLLKQVRAIIKETVPGAEETISYGMPAFTVAGKYLIYFAGYKKHIGVYPIPTGNKIFEKDFSAYKTSGKGTIQFPLNKPIPVDLLIKIVKFRIQKNLEKTKMKGKDQGS
ncbi:MAG TPA: DUF1801 domain-containing protein [Panacibacter sp.]|nr:DUF1801 domain-containing protein [Panacibacter sp.]